MVFMETNLTLRCQRCSHLWTYKGKNKFVTSCSYCKTSVYLKKNLIPSNSVEGPEGKTESKAHADYKPHLITTTPSVQGEDIKHDINCA